MKNFKPFLIKGFEDVESLEEKIELIEKNCIGSISDYIALPKKDGVRVEIINKELKGRSLKPVVNKWLLGRYSKLAEKCDEIGVVLEGELFSRKMSFNEISRRYRISDVTDPKYRKKLLKLTPGELSKEHYNRSIDWLCENHDDLKIWLFDAFYTAPECKFDAETRLNSLHLLFNKGGKLNEFSDLVVLPEWKTLDSFDELVSLYNKNIEDGWEGVILMHKYSSYKFGRATIKEGAIFKLKEDTNEYDGQIIRIIEGETVKNGVAKTINELGRSVTSKKQEDREPSGIASGMLVKYEDGEFKVSFKGCCHTTLRDIWENKDNYIGQWIRYTGMKPTKRYPRHAHSNAFRDEK